MHMRWCMYGSQRTSKGFGRSPDSDAIRSRSDMEGGSTPREGLLFSELLSAAGFIRAPMEALTLPDRCRPGSPLGDPRLSFEPELLRGPLRVDRRAGETDGVLPEELAPPVLAGLLALIREEVRSRTLIEGKASAGAPSGSTTPREVALGVTSEEKASKWG